MVSSCGGPCATGFVTQGSPSQGSPSPHDPLSLLSLSTRWRLYQPVYVECFQTSGTSMLRFERIQKSSLEIILYIWSPFNLNLSQIGAEALVGWKRGERGTTPCFVLACSL